MTCDWGLECPWAKDMDDDRVGDLLQMRCDANCNAGQGSMFEDVVSLFCNFLSCLELDQEYLPKMSVHAAHPGNDPRVPCGMGAWSRSAAGNAPCDNFSIFDIWELGFLAAKKTPSCWLLLP